MKKLLLKTFILICGLLLPTTLQAQESAPTVTGQYQATFNYKALWKEGAGSSGEGVTPIVTVSNSTAGKVDIALPAFIFSEKFAVQPFTVAGVNASTGSDGTVTLALEKFAANDGNYKISGYSLNGTIKDGKIEFLVIYKAGSMPFKLKVNYQGQLQK